jgi:dTDP-4-amino-4,6-dideoxygalactose transaminase
VDVDETTFNLDADCLRAAIAQTVSDGVLHPAGVIAVDLFGQPADYRAINAIAAEHKLFVLGDAAQSFGASYENRAVGNLATATATSFYPAKPLGCYGDGGAIFTDDDDVAATCISIRNHGQSADKYDIVRLGLNARLDTMQAAVLLSKLTIFDDEIRLRRSVARRYTECLTENLGDRVEAIKAPIEMPGSNSIWAQYTIKLAEGRRDDIAAALKARGIPSQIYYPLPMHLQPAYLSYGGGPGSLPVSEQLSKQVLALPMHPYLDDAAIDMICDTLIDAIP